MAVAEDTRGRQAGSGEDGREALLGPLGSLERDIQREVARMDRERRLPPELADALAEAGLFRMMAPSAMGGLEIEPLAAMDVVEAASRIEGSTGWCVMVGAQWQWYLAALPIAGQEAIFPTARLKVAGAMKPGGKAIKVDGGYRVRGQWSFASGCTYAGWLAAACVVDDGRERAPGALPEVRVVYVPAREATIVENWNTPGLRGTGSNDFVLNDVFVTDERTTANDASPHPGPLYRTVYQNLAYTLQGAQALGVARGAFDSFRSLAGGKVRWVSASSLLNDPLVRAQAAEAEVLIESAKAWLRATTADAWATLVAGGEPVEAQRVQLRLAITHAIRASVRAGDLLQAAAGTAVSREDHPLQRQ